MRFTLQAWWLPLALLGVIACNNEREPRPLRQTGIKIVPAGAKTARAPGVKGTIIDMPTHEVRVVLVRPDGAAARAGFHAGDVIRAVAGKEVANEEEVEQRLRGSDAGPLIFEVQRDNLLETLTLNEAADPGWLLLSGDTFKGFLLTRLRSSQARRRVAGGEPFPWLHLPGFLGPDINSRSWRGRPVALLFFTTFSEPCYALLQALWQSCLQARHRGWQLLCAAVDTLELFTAVKRTKQFQAELEKVRVDLWPREPLGVDLFMRAEQLLGVEKVPVLFLLDEKGRVISRLDSADLSVPALGEALARLPDSDDDRQGGNQ